MNNLNSASPSTPVNPPDIVALLARHCTPEQLLAHFHQMSPDQSFTSTTTNASENDQPSFTNAVVAPSLVKNVSYQKVWDELAKHVPPVTHSNNLAEKYFDEVNHIPVDFLRGAKDTYLLSDCDDYTRDFVTVYIRSAMSILLSQQHITEGSGPGCVLIAHDNQFREYYIKCKGSDKAMAVGYYITYGWWATNKVNFFQKVTDKFIERHKPLVPFSGRNGKCSPNFLGKIITNAKTSVVNSYRNQLKKTRIPNFRIWLTNKRNNNTDVYYSFQAECHYEIRNKETGNFWV